MQGIRRVGVGAGKLGSGVIVPPASAAAVERWLAAQGWRKHRPVVKDDGQPKAGGYGKVLSVPDPEGKARLGALLPALTDELRSIWRPYCGGWFDSVMGCRDRWSANLVGGGPARIVMSNNRLSLMFQSPERSHRRP